MERENVLDQYFSDLAVSRVNSEDDAWSTINDNPPLWNKK
jgi:hypothetical protein